MHSFTNSDSCVLKPSFLHRITTFMVIIGFLSSIVETT